MFLRLSQANRLSVVMSLALAGLLVAQIALAADTRPSRVVTIGGAVTEIAYALGQQDRLVARDTTSTYPAESTGLPDIGYMRALSAEGVLSVDPDLIVSVEGSGPPETLDILRAARVDFVEVPDSYDTAGIVTKIQLVGAALGVPVEAAALAKQVSAQITTAQLTAQQAADGTPLRVMFILSTQGGRIMAAGTGTSADGIIRMAGGVNAMTAFEGYKPVTDEAVTLAAPDVILMMDRGGDHATLDDDLFAMPALITTPAAEHRRVVRMNGLHLLGFGPRTASAVSNLSQALYGVEG